MPLRRLIPPVLAAVVLGAVACNDLPTSAPIWKTTWILPVQQDTIGVAQLLPSTVDTAGGQFLITLDRDSVQQTLGSMCPSCGADQGNVAPVSGFTYGVSHTDAFPAQVVSITPGGFALSYRIDNGLNFDPLRPGVGKIGSIVTQVKDGNGNVVATDSVNGSTASFPSGTSLTRSIALGTSPIAGGLTLVATFRVPTTDPVPVDTAERVQVTTLTDTATLAGVTVQLTSQSIQSDSVDVDWSNIDSDVQSRMQGAALKLVMDNPFTISGTGSVRFKQGIRDVIPARTVTFAAGSTTNTIDITASEIRTLIAAGPSTITIDASVAGTGPGNSVAITPSQLVLIDAHVLVTIVVGGK
jgi:hypothetical protein